MAIAVIIASAYILIIATCCEERLLLVEYFARLLLKYVIKTDVVDLKAHVLR